ncbi:uncharacterized protein LOC109535300 [Dendroctonus ponderosae]|uniref:Uncharacterized protein n=1 Tax=Dendroctonus ponderosae TaxID=77166 RepID=A0AAR5NZI6_DENPD|nr:uncharacterized protein LOC109535300 [Dendroctonus ponderosae]KAH0999429.1 hypothetical protein HUJ04_004210 [Dendroctonus ponderosae]KAH1027074.1 hypothetical protein HUJ05_000642 [Dendroctonus ponderosae]
MAIPKSEKKVIDIMKADEMWKTSIRSEDASAKNWQTNWGWILDEYRCLEQKLKEKSAESKFLTHIMEEKRQDPQKLVNFPDTTNHEYGWIASQPNFQLERFGADLFEPQPLPDVYRVPKH